MDANNDGSANAPWATITYAVTKVPDGATILVRPGTYTGTARLDRGGRITLEGFDIAHTGSGAQPLVMQIQSTDMSERTSYIVIRDNVIHDSFNNDIIKLNNGAEHVTIEGNLFYNQSGSDEHIDVNSVRDCVIQDNIFMSDFAGSGRANANDTSAFLVIKDSNQNSDGFLGAERIAVRRNVFLNFEGNSNYGFIQLGEDGTSNFEAIAVTIENNLLLGSSTNPMRSPLALQGVSDITFRNNTVAGNFPGPTTAGFVARMYTYGSNQPNANLRFFNNIYSDPTGTMTRFSISPMGQTASFTLRHNLYWNNGAAIPSNNMDTVNVSSDTEAVMGDPMLGAQAGLVLPRLTGTTLADGSKSICEAFEKLVTTYGTPAMGSKSDGAADPTQAPKDDILGRPRGSAPDLGAVER